MNRYFVYKKITSFVLLISSSFVLSILLYFLYFIISGYINFEIPLLNTGLNSFSINYSTDEGLSKSEKSTKGVFTIKFQRYSKVARVFDLYFKEVNSPLYGYGQTFVDACQKYNAPKDCTLLPAIAKVETNLCTTDISAKQHNCWGFGGSGENRIVYDDFDSAIYDITGRLMQGYGAGFFQDPELGELFYCGAHCSLWGDKVKAEQNRLKAMMGY